MLPINPSRVAVIASARTDLLPAWSQYQHVDLIGQAVQRALLGTGLTMKDIGFVINSGSDVLDGRSISNCGFLGAMGAHHKEESRVEEDGLFSAIYAATKVASGTAPIGLVVAYSKPSESKTRAYYTSLLDPFYQRPTGLDHISAAGLRANQYLTTTGAKREDLDRIAASAWRNAAANGTVAQEDVLDEDAIAALPLVADPLTERHLSRNVDGAVAMLVAAEPIARKMEHAVWITGMGSSMEGHFLADREPGVIEAAGYAARMALTAAGRRDISGIDIAEVTATSAANEAMIVEAIGFAERGRAVSAYDQGSTVINPSGGALPADPIMATGLVRLHEAFIRLSGQAGSGATSALVHGSGGFAQQNHAVFVLEA
jgi:acetyl-CoA C-acetyltransferase